MVPHDLNSGWTFAFWLTEFLRLRGQLIRTGPWSSLINDGVNTQGFLLKNRKVGAGRLQSIRRILPSLTEKQRALLRSGEPGDIEARMRRHDGIFRWFLIRFEPFRDETGKIAMWYGVSTDIEDLKTDGRETA